MNLRSLIYPFKDLFRFVRIQLVILLESREIYLTYSEIEAFTWIVIDGWSLETQKKIKDLGILQGNSINNLGSKLSKEKLLVSKRRGVKVLAPDIHIFKDPNDFIKLGIATNSLIMELQNHGKAEGKRIN